MGWFRNWTSIQNTLAKLLSILFENYSGLFNQYSIQFFNLRFLFFFVFYFVKSVTQIKTEGPLCFYGITKEFFFFSSCFLYTVFLASGGVNNNFFGSYKKNSRVGIDFSISPESSQLKGN